MLQNKPYVPVLCKQSAPNFLLLLKEKKKQVLNTESTLKNKIKQYCSDLTLTIQDRQIMLLQTFQNKLYNLLESIDSYCAMTEMERITKAGQIDRILNIKFQIAQSNSTRELLEKNIIIESFDQEQINQVLEDQTRTNKKSNQQRLQLLKQSYLQQIQILEQRIQKLMLKEDKIKAKITQMENRQKMKKVGNSYLPFSQQKLSSNLLTQRLEAENKILVQRIADCSQKILGLQSQNSMLAKQKQNSHFLPTTQKKRIQQSLHIIEESFENNRKDQQINTLKIQLQQVQRQLQNQNKLLHTTQHQNDSLKMQLQQKQVQIEQLLNYKRTLQKECDEHINKEIQLKHKIQQHNKKYLEMLAQCNNRSKQYESIKQMNNSFSKLLKIKQQKIIELSKQNQIINSKLRQSQQNYNFTITERNNKQALVKNKQNQIQTLKAVVKKQQGQKSVLNKTLADKQMQIFEQKEKIKLLEAQLSKANKEKQSYAKKQVSKLKKDYKKIQQEQSTKLLEDFKIKYGEFLQKLDQLKSQFNDSKDKYDRKHKVQENILAIFKDKTTYEMKEMLEKINKSGKQKIATIIQSYIQNQATVSTKTAQIKMLKDELATLKKQPAKKQQIKAVTQIQVYAELQQFQKTLFQEKLQLQRQIYEAKFKQQKEQSQLTLQQNVALIETLNSKCQNLEKINKQLKTQLLATKSQVNPELMELRKVNEQMGQKQQRMQSLITSLKNNLGKVQSQAQQTKEQLKLKKDIIVGLKKETKDKQMEKNKLTQTVNTLMDEMDKLKRSNKEANKKEVIFSQFKEKLITQTELTQEICTLRANLEQKQKMHKIQMGKKDQIIKELKSNQQTLLAKVKNIQNLHSEISDLKQKIKKMKSQLDRKDTLLEHLKQKHQKANNQLSDAADAAQGDLKRVKKQLQIEKNKLQTTKLKLNKLQTNYQMLKITLVKLYDQIQHKYYSSATSIQKQYNTYKTASKDLYQFTTIQKTTAMELSKYKEALSILQLSSEDLQITVPKTQPNFFSPILDKGSTMACQQNSLKLTKLLDSDQIDCKEILQVFNLVVES